MGNAVHVDGIGTDRLALTFISAARSYWLSVFPHACRELRSWRARAQAIPDPGLRALALATHGDKRANLEGAAAFATFVAPPRRRDAVRALVAYQATFDYLDNLSEQPSDDPISHGRQLNSALLMAIAARGPCAYTDCHVYREHGEDGGYLQALIATCRTAVTALPSFATIAGLLRSSSERVIAYQSLNHGDGDGRYSSFERWARKQGKSHAQLHWWELGAAAGSTLDVLALIAAATDPQLELNVAESLRATYFPWIGALHSLLDSLADREEDATSGMRGLIDYYTTPREAAERMSLIATEGMSRARELPGGSSHALMLAAMTSFYLCELSRSSSPHARLAIPAVLEAMGALARPSMLILSTRRTCGRISGRFTERTTTTEQTPRLAAHRNKHRMLESAHPLS